jgi:hypothetical protein
MPGHRHRFRKSKDGWLRDKTAGEAAAAAAAGFSITGTGTGTGIYFRQERTHNTCELVPVLVQVIPVEYDETALRRSTGTGTGTGTDSKTA